MAPVMKTAVFILCVVFVLGVNSVQAFSQNDDQDDTIVTLTPGQQLKGFKEKSSWGVDVLRFLGIPYALPPTGNRRFEVPQLPAKWQGVKDATTPSSICHQVSSEAIDNAFPHSEDCLYLNVYTTDTKASLPVMVWIHGGGFFIGSGYHDGDGSTLATKGIVVVTINYRLGPFGFLATEDRVMPGNYGLHDQIMALRWVQNNIKAFGGDPNQVTIAGESAGACSVSYLLLSPLADGLFQRAIMESGSSLTLPMFETPGTRYKIHNITTHLGNRVGCNQVNPVAFFLCLQSADAMKILQAYTDMGESLGVRYLGIPTVDKKHILMPEYPIRMLREGRLTKVNTLRGYNSGEWSFSISDPTNVGITREEFVKTVESQLSFISQDTLRKVSKIAQDIYMGAETDPMKLRSDLIHALVDIAFAGASLLELNETETFTNGGAEHFLYEFDYRASDDTTPEWYGVTHAQERQFVFFNDTRTSDPMDKAVGNAVQTMWSNFVKFGAPTPVTNSRDDQVQWKPYTMSNRVMLKIDSKSTLVPYPRQQEVSAFEKILKLMMAGETWPERNVVIG